MRTTTIKIVSTAAVSFFVGAPLLGETPTVPLEFVDSHCVGCHNADDANGGIRLDRLSRLDWKNHETSHFVERVMKAIRSKQMPPPDDVIPPSDKDREAAVSQLHETLMHHSRTGGTVLRRLNQSEYENTVRDVFGISFQVPPGFPTDATIAQFDNTADSLVMSGPLMEAYFNAAISVADTLIPPPKKPVQPTLTAIPADELVISYSSGAVIDNAMRLAAKSNTMWRSSTWPEKWEARTAGTYQIRVSASRFAPGSKAFPEFNDPMKLQIRARSLNSKDGDAVTKQRLLAEFELKSDDPEDFECEVTLQPNETPIFYFANAVLDGDGDGKKAFDQTLRSMFKNDPRLLGAWLKVKHSSGLRGGLGWRRVKKLRDSKGLELSAIDMSEAAVNKLLKTMVGNPGLYVETVIFQFFEEGPSLEIHGVEIEGPTNVIESAAELKQQAATKQFLGEPGERTDAEYVEDFMRRFLANAFRRPASDQDVRDYSAVVLDHMKDGHDIKAGLHLGIRTALMSPSFLYRGHRETFDEFDLATRLAYFLTSRPPDEKLYAAAVSGKLSDDEALEAQALRLLTSPESKSFVSSFTAQWLETHELSSIMPDPRLFPNFTEQHRDAMVTETELFFAEILRKDLPLETFIRPDFTFLDRRLGRDIYQIKQPPKKDGVFRRVSIEKGSPHAGLLGQASVMMATANGVDTQPVVRGVWVLENILGDPAPEPPEDVPALTPDTRNAKTVRELLAAHRSDSNCASCHKKIDPLGFVLENFDPVGRWRTNYPVHGTSAKGKPTVEAGAEVNANGTYPGDATFENVNDLKDYVVDNIDKFENCLSGKLLTYATGRELSYAEREEIRQIVDRVIADNGGFRDLLLALVRSNTFRQR